MTTTRPAWAYTLPAALLLMAPFDILASLAMDIYLPVVPAMPGILNTTPSTIQLTLSLYMVMLGVGQVIFGPLSDRIGRRPVLLAGGVIFVVASLGAAWSSTAAALVAFRLLQAVGASAALVATFATVRDVYASQPEGVVIYGLFSSMLAFVPALGPIAGALIGEFFGWRAIFVTLAALALPALLNAGFRWHETRPLDGAGTRRSVLPIFASPAFWVYTVGFSAGMGTFFVFFSTAPRVLIGQADYSEIGFSLAFATVAFVMIVTTRFAKSFVARWGIAGCVARGMALLVCGAVLLGIGELYGSPSFLTFVLPMWVMAVGIVVTVSVTANGALAQFDDIAGSAVAFYFCIQSLIVSIVGTLAVTLLNGDTAWPVIVYATTMAVLVSVGLALLRSRDVPSERSPVV
ncbi:chloramphenicol/florfenicol efflux MFS transporter FloR (plasmid) [Pseudomonas fulva]|uniref:Bcr/CflA family efflux transporter n=4 Tax=Gammaproteobacteria TaxID=1236 RepID=A0A0A0QY56_STEMA|nr:MULTISPECIES: chloramphenicol/florfenicol efflux MFS transporter FloR [Gammaproteobacteria]AIU94575.1 chloramphenicol and florfenicol resistance protein variant [Stenotrophomonas maltophilia]EKU6312961.1 chloramphenicol/florfenicol efflux MFS transporter FloR [Pseudomonas aeruginosa]EKU6313161.1 chloramphenicol/florfenicol efflux MFS transporter FloR [Pseudomonas aeruginosa]EKX2974413.1 chloramphenicol/florfenicol efflux MFS transporter FloR [Pseudomonas aeruginosa]EKX2974609.1 chlorampheni